MPFVDRLESLEPSPSAIPATVAPCVKHALGNYRFSRYNLTQRAATQEVRSSSMSFVFLNPVIWLVDTVLGLYTFVIIAAVVASWLIAFGVLNTSNQVVRQIVQVLDALTEPLFRQVRKVIPPIGGLDLSPIIVLIGIQFLGYVIDNLLLYLIYRV
jgi:YggT family protein